MTPPTLIVFGGSFNPPHIAHLAVAEAAADAVENSRVLWIPAATPPHKRGDVDLASAGHRLEMTRLATSGNDRFEVSDSEIKRGAVSFTVDTLRTLKEERPGSELALLVGGDSLAQFPSWREPEAILEMARLLVYRREGDSVDEVPAWIRDRVTVIDAPRLDLSSTELRARICAGRSMRYLVPDSTRAFIEQVALYL